jgi:alpha-1,2-mannosyltransferase
MQDYAAAWAWWHGGDPNGKTAEILASCCPEVQASPSILQTAHPPFATLLTLPFALLSWQAAQWFWLLVSWGLVMWSWHQAEVPALACAVTAPLWLVALSLGALEPLIFALIVGGLLLQQRHPVCAGALVGLAGAIKVYPVLLLCGLWLSGRRQVALAGAATGLAATLLAEVILGFGVTSRWLAYTPMNTLFHLETARNLSLVRVLHFIVPTAPPTLLALGVFGLLLIPILPAVRRSDGMKSLLPVALMVSPLCWEQYLALLGLNRLGRIEQALLAVSGTTIGLVWLHLIPGDGIAIIGYGPLLVVLLLQWYRQLRAARRTAEPLPPTAHDPEQPVLPQHP